MCIEYDRTPIDTDTYLLLYVCPWNTFFFVHGEGAGVVNKYYHGTAKVLLK